MPTFLLGILSAHMASCSFVLDLLTWLTEWHSKLKSHQTQKTFNHPLIPSMLLRSFEKEAQNMRSVSLLKMSLELTNINERLEALDWQNDAEVTENYLKLEEEIPRLGKELRWKIWSYMIAWVLCFCALLVTVTIASVFIILATFCR